MDACAPQLHDTIVACASGRGPVGVAIVRLSGPRALQIAQQLVPARRSWASHLLQLARVVDAQGLLIDIGMAVVMRAPRSYTGEDVVELHLHGSEAVVAAVEQAAQSAGARLAEPGEFTRRAFVYGKITLAQAEATGALIAARDEVGYRGALHELVSGLAQQATAWLTTLEAMLARVFAALDFPEYVADQLSEPADGAALAALADDIRQRRHRAVLPQQTSYEVVVAGASNIGKSTLFNALLGEERALTDNSPGTTRDHIRAPLSAALPTLQLSDVAGVRRDAHALEARGIAMAQRAVKTADCVVWLVDGQAPMWPPAWASSSCLLVYGSRADTLSAHERQALSAQAATQGLRLAGFVSGRSGEGVAQLRAQLVQQRQSAQSQHSAAMDTGERWLAQARQLELLDEAEVALRAAVAHLVAGAPLDLVATELRAAVAALGRILGRDVDARVLEQIFAQFCIGK